MARRIYVNKSSGGAKEFFGFLLILALLALVGALVWFMLDDAGKTGGEILSAEQNEQGGAANPAATAGQAASVSAEAAGTYLAPSEAEMRQLWDIVRSSPHITGNRLYSAVMENAEFRYLSGENTVNAFAAMHSTGSLGMQKRPLLCLLGGYVRLSRVLALAYAANQQGVADAMPKLLEMWKTLSNGFSEAAASAFIEDAGLAQAAKTPEIVVKARAVSSGMILAALAHEAGHHALGHLHGGIDTETREVSRNREREADSFSASIMSLSPFGEYMLSGELLYYAIDAKVGGGGFTHPYSEERLENLIKANPVLSKAIGLAEE